MPRPRGGQRPSGSNGGGGGGSRFSALNDYQNDHDDRDNGRKKDRNTTRRVSFKPSALQHKGGITSRLAEMGLQSHLAEDEDIVLGKPERKYDSREPRRKGSPIPRGRFSRGPKLTQSQFDWYQVTAGISSKPQRPNYLSWASLAGNSCNIFLEEI